MSSTNLVSIPAKLLTRRQCRALESSSRSDVDVVTEYLDSWQLAKTLNVSERTIDTWKHKGVIPFLRVGRVVRFDLDAVKRALEKYQVISK